MSIATAIQNAQQRVANAYTAISNKGGTLPATQNLANMPTAINSIPSGSTEIPSYQVSNGVASRRSGALTGNTFSGITSVGSDGLAYAFYFCSGLTGTLNLSSLTTIGSSGLYYAFYQCTGLTSVDLSSLTSVSNSGLYYAFYDCTGLTGSLDLSSLTSVGNYGLSRSFTQCSGLTSVDLSSLTSVSNSGLYYAFYQCTGLTSVDLSSLTSVSNSGLYYAFYDCTGLTGSLDLSSLTSVGSAGLQYAFADCKGLTDIYFNSLKTTSFGSYTNQFRNILSSTGTSVTHTLHFPSNLESTIQGLSGYPNFGGTSGYVVLSFDLPATS